MKKHINIPIFIPMMGCPFACIYCSQTEISGHTKPDFSKIEDEINQALKTTDPQKQDIQLAYFGGSFTGIPREDMIFLLEVGNKFIKEGRIHSIRCSTRPDFINEEIVEILKRYNVTTVELGVQSSNDNVLEICRRGHTFAQTKKAAKLLTESGIKFGGQMMIGLPNSTKEDEVNTAKEIVKMNAVQARIYPCVVLKNTYLEVMTRLGKYTPLKYNDAIERCEEVFEVFNDSGVDVIRIGLQSSDSLTSGDDIAYGFYDESIGEKCHSLYFKKQIFKFLKKNDCENKNVIISVNSKKISSCVGYKRENKKEIFKAFKPKNVIIKGQDDLKEFEIEINIE